MNLLLFFNTALNQHKFPRIFLPFIIIYFLYPSNAFAESTAPTFQKASQERAINILEEKKKLDTQLKITENLEDEFISDEQATTLEETEEVADDFDSLYKIELLIFAYVNTGDENSEVWINLVRPDFSDITQGSTAKLSSKESDTEITTPLQINKTTLLNPDEKGVSDFKEIIRKMKINGHYRPLKHLVWQQKVLDESAQDLFYVHGGNRYLNYDDALTLQNQKNTKTKSQMDVLKGESEMEGIIHIYRSRYLHIKPNLWLSEYTKNDAGLCLESDGDQGLDYYISNKSIPSYTQLTNFQINQHRRIRSGEIHYLDHPRFGLLIKFTRVAKPVVKNSDPYNPE